MPIGCVFVDPATGAVLARGRNRTNVDFNVRRSALVRQLEQLVHPPLAVSSAHASDSHAFPPRPRLACSPPATRS